MMSANGMGSAGAAIILVLSTCVGGVLGFLIRFGSTLAVEVVKGHTTKGVEARGEARKRWIDEGVAVVLKWAEQVKGFVRSADPGNDYNDYSSIDPSGKIAILAASRVDALLRSQVGARVREIDGLLDRMCGSAVGSNPSPIERDLLTLGLDDLIDDLEYWWRALTRDPLLSNKRIAKLARRRFKAIASNG